MIIGIDLDDVLMDFLEHFYAYVNSKYGTSHRRTDCHSFGIENVWNVPKEDVDQKILEFYNSHEHTQTDPFPGSVEGIRALKQAGHELHIITSKPDRLKEMTETWVQSHFPDTFAGIHFMNEFHGTGVKRSKADVCKLLGVEVFIDDALHNAKSVAATGVPVLMPDAPWNQGEVAVPITRVKSWKEIVDKMRVM